CVAVLSGQFAGLSTGVHLVEEHAEAGEHRSTHDEDADDFGAAHACGSCVALAMAARATGCRGGPSHHSPASSHSRPSGCVQRQPSIPSSSYRVTLHGSPHSLTTCSASNSSGAAEIRRALAIFSAYGISASPSSV